MKSKPEIIIAPPEENETIIKLRTRKFPWWIFLFLLPLLLLVKCEKDITFKVVNQTNKVLANAKTSFTYTRRVLFTKNTITFTDSTNSEGMVTFKDTEFSLYTLIFNRNDTCNFAVQTNCFQANSAVSKYHSLHEKDVQIVELDYIKKDITFVIIKDPENIILPDAEVKIKVENETSTYEDIDTSDVAGLVTFKNVPLCSKIHLTASCYGYYDTTYNFISDSIYNNIKNINLRPITKSINFWVKNLITKQPIPYAEAELIIDEKYSGYKIHTNTNGIFSVVENGMFEKVHIIKYMKVFATKTDFYDTIYPEPSKKVSEFIEADAQTRTVYLRPKAKCVEFKIIDNETKGTIDGAECIITKNGSETKTEYSNINGIVQICGLMIDDIISISASKVGYILNDYTVKDLKVENITSIIEIPLDKVKPPAKKISVTLKIFDYNNAQDDYYNLYLNGTKIGVVENEIGGISVYEIEAEEGSTIKVDMILTKDMGNGTGATISIDPGFYSESIGGTIDHTFYIKIPK